MDVGCGRCELVGTPQCKVKTWQDELRLLREIVLECGLVEELKWQQPCYTLEGKNILIVSAFKEYAALNFFKGSLLKDPHNLLVQPGNSTAGRQIRFTDVDEIRELRSVLKEYILDAMEVERSGKTVPSKKVSDLEVPAELEHVMDTDDAFRVAFEALTPGRQKAYILHFAGAKQAATREARIERYRDRILDGKGIFDCVCGFSKRMPNCDGSHKNHPKPYD